MRGITDILLILSIALPGLPGALARQQPQEAQPTATPLTVEITAPSAGSALQGTIAIIGTTEVDDMVVFELAFAYTNNPTDSWFLIRQGQDATRNNLLAEWDTTTITDGDYDLHLVVTLENGEQITSLVRGLRVRNYSLVETNTPTPVTPTETPNPSRTPAPTLTPTRVASITPSPRTPTALPPNPVELSKQQVYNNVGLGALASLGLMTFFGLYLGLRRALKRGWRA